MMKIETKLGEGYEITISEEIGSDKVFIEQWDGDGDQDSIVLCKEEIPQLIEELQKLCYDN